MITLGCEADWRIHRLQSVLILGVVMACPVAHAEYFASLEQCLVRAASANEQYQVAYKQWNRALNDLLKLDAFDTARAAYGLVYEQLGKRLDAAFRQWRVIEGICSEIRSKNDAKELEISNRKAAEAKRIADAAKAAADAKEKASKAAEVATNPAKAAVNKAKAKLDGAAESALAKARAGDATENPSTNHIYDNAGALSAKTSQSGVITAVQKNALKEIQRQHNTMLGNVDAYAKFKGSAPAYRAQTDPPPVGTPDKRGPTDDTRGLVDPSNPWNRTATSSDEDFNPWKAKAGARTEESDPWKEEARFKASLEKQDAVRKAAANRKAEREEAASDRAARPHNSKCDDPRRTTSDIGGC